MLHLCIPDNVHRVKSHTISCGFRRHVDYFKGYRANRINYTSREFDRANKPQAIILNQRNKKKNGT